ncbi:hypothetical protein [Bradyrhizobium sp. AZCC 2230]|uniref:hypothetical protein n=1 Tax=Bradyrhizobium sp. AZCC 2230 TaxID=3117021 RepID=UPI002FEE9DD9
MSAKSEKLCFVVGPIGSPGEDTRNHADLLLEFIIKPVMLEFPGIVVKRQDEDSKPGMIDTQIIVALRDADLVIADLSHLNPNAFYEIGIRHMVSKPIVHMQLDNQRIPFDVSLYKTVKFSFLNPETYRKARLDLKAQVSQALADNYVTDNPVTRALGQQSLKETKSSELKVVSDMLSSLGSRMDALEGRTVRASDDFRDGFRPTGPRYADRRPNVVVTTAAQTGDELLSIASRIASAMPPSYRVIPVSANELSIQASGFVGKDVLDAVSSIEGVVAISPMIGQKGASIGVHEGSR